MKPTRALPILALLLAGSIAFAQQDTLVNGVDTSGNVQRIIVDSTGHVLLSPDVCTTIVESVVSVGLTATAVPASALGSRKLVVICNSPENTGTPLLKCRGDGTNPVIGLTQAGQTLKVGDCINYTTTAAINCIADTAATGASVTECK